MSQSRMNPSVNFSHVDGTGYDDRTAQIPNAYLHPWNFAGPRVAIESVPSPTNTIHTVRTAPSPRTATRMSFQQSDTSLCYNNIDPNLQGPRYLAPPGAQSFSNVQNNFEPIVDPIARFYQGDEPWNPIRPSSTSAGRNTFSQPQYASSQYRQKPCSEVGSNAPVSDSGYHTHPTQSILSIDPSQVEQDLPSEIMVQTKALDMRSTPTESKHMVGTASDQRSVSQYSNRSETQRQQIRCQEPGCDVILKCQSSHKKHMLKHRKEFLCNVPGCKRSNDGFSTVNDLDRHKKSVHKIGMANSKSWQCAAKSCTNKTKIWPRLDNFKQHIERMHKGEDMDDLIQRSEYCPQEVQTTVQLLSVDPSHLLAGMGSETDLATGSPNNSTLSASMQKSMYPPYVSLSRRSYSGASQASPSTDSLDVSTLQSNMPSFNSTSGNLLMNKSFPQSTGSLPENRSSHQNSPRVSFTRTITESTPEESSTHIESSKLQLQLSNTPQTKSEQQQQRQQALEKLSRVNLEEILLRVLSEQQQGSGDSNPSMVLSENERLHASQAIADLVKERSKPSRALQRRSTQGSSSGMHHCVYENCNFFGRTCDLNKHLKRHYRPYGCTYPKCYKKFGAKSDWKRHENSQHFQQEAFRCDYLFDSGERCGQYCYRVAQFQNHLECEHKVTSKDKLQSALTRCKIGKNCQVQYWCGFCCEIKALRTRCNEAWDERFDHIAHHFEKDLPKKCIDDWVCVEENQAKKELQEKLMSDKRGEEGDTKETDDDKTSTAHETKPARTAGPNEMPMPRGVNKRSTSSDTEDFQRPKKQKKQSTILWGCCECDDISSNLQVVCLCEHAFCVNCIRFYADDNELYLDS